MRARRMGGRDGEREGWEGGTGSEKDGREGRGARRMGGRDGEREG